MTRSGYAAANGIDFYYEVYGEGEPLLALHGRPDPRSVTMSGRRHQTP